MSPASDASPPRIRVYDSHHYALPHHPGPPFPSAAAPMAIPRARQEIAPPALPPPRRLANLPNAPDPAWQWASANSSTDTGFLGNGLASIKPGSSLYGSSFSGPPRKLSTDRIVPKGLDASKSPSFDDISSDHSPEHNSDQDHRPSSRPSLGNHRFISEPGLERNAYDRQLLSKIGGPTRISPSASSSSAPDSATPTVHKLNGQLKPLSVPDRLHSTLDSPASRWSTSGALSPGHSVFRSPVFDSPAESHRARFGSISTPGPLDEAPAHHRGSYDHTAFSDPDFGMEETGMRQLDIQDRAHGESENYPPGSKRRASSPPTDAAREGRPTTSGHNDLYHRRSAQMLVNRNASSRFPASSFSSIGSGGQRAGSMGSSYGFSTAASSMTSCGGDQRVSPSALSPHPETDLGASSPYTHRSLDPSPRASLSRPHHPQHQRGFSETEHPQIQKLSAESVLHSRQNSITNRISGTYMCECCPKKPKKFDNEEDLRAHELEKQYICQYCKNRFKNKNEAERHQNSLHLRTHSWSCATLAAPNAAFHPSLTRPSAFDVCGYCGEEFPNPADWEARSEHLNHVHKFGECNQAKKFWRADHFRQHLKHSHAGTSGKWTNMLENACMREEPQPERVGSEGSISGPSTGPLESMTGVTNETHGDS